MAPRQNVDVHKLVRHINVGLRRYGLADRNGNLKEIVICGGDKPQEMKRIVLTQISFFFHLSERCILNSTERGHVTEARVMAIILLSRHAEMTSAQLSRLFHCTPRLVNQRLATFRSAEMGKKTIKNYGDKLFLHKVNKVNIIIKEHIEHSRKGHIERSEHGK